MSTMDEPLIQQHPIFDEVSLDLKIDFDTIKDRPRWTFEDAITRIENSTTYKKTIRAAHQKIQKDNEQWEPTPRRSSVKKVTSTNGTEQE